MSATCAVRIILTSCPPRVAAVASMLTGMICAHRPWSGPPLSWPQLAVIVEGQLAACALPGITEYWVKVTPTIEGGLLPTAQICDAEGGCEIWHCALPSESRFS